MATHVVCSRSEAGRSKFLEVRCLGLILQITWSLGLVRGGAVGECKVRSGLYIQGLVQMWAVVSGPR